ncbi:Uma2 family endonuclease [Kitasatospora sp. NPDC101155]|uniref:Uma2 family endonuclease n=1 Tax=Kitasatospora sp. NPDC101155 TaxID=3364097 RepID=UPI003820509A
MSVAAVEQHVGPWTVDDVLALPEDTHHRIELLGGALLLTPHPEVPHQRASSRLAVLLNTAIEACAAPVEVLTAINLLVPDGLLIPDLVVADVAAAATAGLTLRASDVLVAIEVTAPSTRVAATVLKPAMYAAAGIPHYWRLELDPAPRLHLGHLEDGVYVDRLVQAGETTQLTDPFRLDLDPAVLRRSPRH